MAERVIHISAAEAASDFGKLLERVRAGAEVVIEAAGTTEAWELGANRVWLHTCTLDSPRALPNYRARGFREFRRETYTSDIDAAART